MFASLLRAAYGGPGDRSPWSDFMFTPIGGQSVAGQRVNADAAMRLAAVFSCVKVLSESMGMLPFRLYRPKVGGGRQRVTDHWLVRLFTRRPNPYQNWYEWRLLLQGHLSLRGNAYCRITSDGAGGVAALTPIHPDRIRPVLLDSGDWRYRITNLDGTQQDVLREQVLHLKSMSADGISGISPIEAAREVFGGALGAQDYANRFFANDQRPGGWLKFPGKIPNDEQRKVLKSSISEAVTGVNRHKMLVLDQGMEFHEVGLSNKDSQFIEARQLSRDEICGIFRVPPHMIANLTRSTNNNIEQQAIDFWSGTMLPWTILWEAAAESLLIEEDLDAGLNVEFDMREKMRGDSQARSTYIGRLVTVGVLTRNEGREMEGHDPIEGLDTPLVPTNEMTLEQSQEPPEPVQQPGIGQPAKEQEPGAIKIGFAAVSRADVQAAVAGAQAHTEQRLRNLLATAEAGRLQTLVAGNAERMARRIAKGDQPAADVLAAALAVPEETAAAWLAAHRGGGPTLDAPAEDIAASLRALGGLS